MTIGIDIRLLARGAKTGVEEYTINLLENMLGLDKNIKYKLFYNGYEKVKLDYDWLKLSNVILMEFNLPNRLLDFSSRFLNYPKIDKLLKGIDVFFSPHIFLSRVSPKCPIVITFHDLSFERYPEFYSRSKNYWHFSMSPRKQAKRADKIIAVSESTKEDLMEIYKISSEKIKIIYSGINPISNIQYPISNISEIRKKYNLPKKYILYLGTLEPRKNIMGLIKAYELLRKKFQTCPREASGIPNSKFQIPKLVIAGSKGWLYEDIFKTARNSPFRKDIIFTGFVAEEDKPFLYGLADLFVYPSFYEGFGFPPLEAMSFGAPVITSNMSSLPEAVEDAAIMVDPYNLDELSKAMEMVLTDEKLKKHLIQKGCEQIKKFSWANCAKETLRVLETIRSFS